MILTEVNWSRQVEMSMSIWSKLGSMEWTLHSWHVIMKSCYRKHHCFLPLTYNVVFMRNIRESSTAPAASTVARRSLITHPFFCHTIVLCHLYSCCHASTAKWENKFHLIICANNNSMPHMIMIIKFNFISSDLQIITVSLYLLHHF